MDISEVATMDRGLHFDQSAEELALPVERDSGFVSHRPVAAGKFLRAGEQRLWVKGVTYGTFRGEDQAGGYPQPDVVDADFAGMKSAGINTVRTYTVPPRWLLDTAQQYGLRAMIGLPWEQHIAF